MSNYFLKSGNTYRVTCKEAMDLHEIIPAGNYVLKQDQYGNYFLESIDNFTIPNKLYGDTTKDAARILNTYKDRLSSTGVLLSGEKGSGKTLLAKQISNEAAKKNIPTIVINSPHHGEAFNTLIQGIEQECILLFDEFEKVYESEQEAVLTLLDGVFSSKKLFIFTCNNKWKIDENMHNRPGRIFYMLEFEGIDVNFVIEYCNDNLLNKSHIDSVCRVSSLFDKFNFDMLQALVEDMNRYNETASEVLRMLNTKPDNDSNNAYTVDLSIDGIPVNIEENYWYGNPIVNNSTITIAYNSGPVSINKDIKLKKSPSRPPRTSRPLDDNICIESEKEYDENENSDINYATFTLDDMKSFDGVKSRYVFFNGTAHLILTKQVMTKNSYRDYIL
jgi:hypothetical protein